MYKYIKSSYSDYRPYLVTFGWDSGGPESGPLWHKGEDIVYATSEEEACSIWEDENVEQFNGSAYGGYEGCWARLATQDEVDEYERFQKEAEDEYNYMLEQGWI